MKGERSEGVKFCMSTAPSHGGVIHQPDSADYYCPVPSCTPFIGIPAKKGVGKNSYFIAVMCTL